MEATIDVAKLIHYLDAEARIERLDLPPVDRKAEPPPQLSDAVWLRRAADVLRYYGWRSAASWIKGEGRCLLQALALAANDQNTLWTEVDPPRALVDLCQRELPNLGFWGDAPRQRVYTWNDVVCVSQEQAVAMLERAAVLAS